MILYVVLEDKEVKNYIVKDIVPIISNFRKQFNPVQHMGDSQTFVKALLDWSSKNFLGGSNVIFVPNLYYFWPKKHFFLPFSRFFFTSKKLSLIYSDFGTSVFSLPGDTKITLYRVAAPFWNCPELIFEV